jgi:hypothetical protein
MTEEATLTAPAEEIQTNGHEAPPADTVHAVLQNEQGVSTLSFRTKKELAKALSENPDAIVLGVFKGRKLEIKEKKLYNFC